jgi:hypothetical protein
MRIATERIATERKYAYSNRVNNRIATEPKYAYSNSLNISTAIAKICL